MALPVSFDADLSVGDQNSYHPAMKSGGGNYYTVLRGTVANAFLNNISLHKATDPTSSFAQQDTEALGAGGSGEIMESIWCYQKGGAGNDTVDIAAQRSGGSSNTVFHTTTDLSADTLAAETTVDTAPAGDEGPNAIACSVSREETGTDIVVAYQGDSDPIKGTDYARIDVKRWTGAAWGSAIAIDNGGEVHWTGPVIVQGSSDRMHIFFKADAEFDAYQRTLRSDDSLETFPSSFDVNTRGTVYIFGRGVSYDDGGTQRVRIAYLNSDGPKLDGAKLDSADSPTVTSDDAFSDNNVWDNNASRHGYANDGTTLHCLYIDNVQDLWHDENADDGGWGTDTEVLDAVTVNHISPNVYDRSGKKLAYIYLNGTTVQYNEVTLAAVFTPDVNAFRFYSDGTESGSSPKADEDIDIELDPAGDAQFHLRFRVQNQGSLDGDSTDDYALEVSKNSGSFAAVTGASSDVQSDTASGLTADGATTNRATNGIADGTGSFVAGEQEETNGVIENRQLTASNFTEHVWACKLIDADLGDGDTLDFRVTLNGGTPGMTNSVTPRITTPGGADLSTRRIDLGGDGMLLISGG